MKYSDTDIMSLKVVEISKMSTISLLVYIRVILRMMLMCLTVSHPLNPATTIQKHTVNNSMKRCSVMAALLYDVLCVWLD